MCLSFHFEERKSLLTLFQDYAFLKEVSVIVTLSYKSILILNNCKISKYQNIKISKKYDMFHFNSYRRSFDISFTF